MLWQLIKLIRTNFSLSLLGLNEPIVRQPLCDFLHSFWLKVYSCAHATSSNEEENSSAAVVTSATNVTQFDFTVKHFFAPA